MLKGELTETTIGGSVGPACAKRSLMYSSTDKRERKKRMNAAEKEESVATTKCNNNINKKKASTPPSADVMMIDFWTAFARMQEQQDVNVFVWPTPKSPANFISSTFGMRIRHSDNCNDFHRGVDIHGDIGDPVVASYHGIVQCVTSFGGGNQVVIIEHKFDFPVRFHDKKITKWYTLYLHLNQQLVAEGDVVQAGDLIGTLGDTGVLPGGGPHLHHEVRLGTRCSLEYALTQHPSINGNNNKRNNNMVDPHVHPMYIYPRHLLGTPSITMTLKQNCCAKDGREILIETTDTCPNVNRFEVQIFYNTVNEQTLQKAHVLDYNLRLGFNPTTTIELDTVDTTKPYLQPIPFGYKTSRWRIKLIIPTSWVNLIGGTLNKAGDKDKEQEEDFVVVVTVTNIWQDAPSRLKFGWNCM